MPAGLLLRNSHRLDNPVVLSSVRFSLIQKSIHYLRNDDQGALNAPYLREEPDSGVVIPNDAALRRQKPCVSTRHLCARTPSVRGRGNELQESALAGAVAPHEHNPGASKLRVRKSEEIKKDGKNCT